MTSLLGAQEELCRVIDQRLRDQATVLRLQSELEMRGKVFWTGSMTISNAFIRGIIKDGPSKPR